jgi:D-alanine-D-alanine ligase
MNFSKTIAAITDISKNDPENVISPFDIQFKSNIFKLYAYGTANFSVRYNSKEKLEEIEHKIDKIINIQRRKKIYQIQFEGANKRPAMVQTSKNEDFYDSIQSVAKKIDVRISKEHRWSSADICHILQDQPKIDGLGPVGEYTGTGNERIIRHSLLERSLLLALIMMSD